MKSRAILSLVVFGVASLLSADDGGSHFSSPTAGLSFTKPESWVFATLEATQENREKVRLNDAELESQMKTQATPPLAVVMKHPEPYPDLNPSFQVGLRPLGSLEGKSAREILEIILPTLEKAYADYKLVAPVSEATIGGLPAARVGVEYTLKTSDGGAYPTRSDMVIVPRGKFMFFIGMGRKPEDNDAATEVDQMLKSVEIQP